MITCKQLTRFLDDYLAAALSPQQRRQFEEHLGVCPDCVNYLAQYRQTVALGRAAFVDENAPADAPPGLLKAILAATKPV